MEPLAREVDQGTEPPVARTAANKAGSARSSDIWRGARLRAIETLHSVFSHTPLESRLAKWERRELIDLLRAAAPDFFSALGEAKVIPAFQRAYARVPAYRELVQKHSQLFDPTTVKTIADFRRAAPFLDKHSTFKPYPIRELCVDGNLEGVCSLLTSSGMSGVYSFGVNTNANLALSSKMVDVLLQYFIGVDDRPTLLINCLPMGVRFITKAAVVAETSVHSGMVLELVKKFGNDFEQIVLFGENSFIKKIIEDGTEYEGIDWHKLRVHLCIGEEPVAENYRTYMAGLIGIKSFTSASDKLIISTLGAGELGLNLFFETRETVAIRRLAHGEPALRVALFGERARHYCPMFFVYNPVRCYVEAPGQAEPPGQLAITMLDADLKVQLPRFRPGDIGQILDYRQVVATLERFGHPIEPELKLPFVTVFGRDTGLETAQGPLYPEAVKEAIYADAELASRLTGNFRLLRDGDAPRIVLQLRKDKTAPEDAAERLLGHLRSYTEARPHIALLGHDGFPYNMGIDYERKFQYL